MNPFSKGETNPETPADQTQTPETNVPTPGEKSPDVTETTPEAVTNVAGRLSEETVKEVEVDETKPQANTPQMIDLANLSFEQLQNLKSMLNVTPDRAQQKRGNIHVKIRKIVKDDKDRYIVDFKPARAALVFDAELGKERESHKIEVKLDGETEYFDMLYPDFMNTERVDVEVVDQREVENIREEGEVVQRETGKLVMKETKIMTYFYTLLLPNGKRVEVEGKLVNA